MLNIEKYRKQVDRLKDCFHNLQSACNRLDNIINSTDPSVDDLTEAIQQISRCQQTITSQLKLMNMQNENELKS